MEEFDKLMKLKLAELQKIAKDEKIKFQENDTKTMLATAILAAQASKAIKSAGKGPKVVKVDKKKVAEAKKRLEQQNEARKIAEAEAAKIKVTAAPSPPEEKTPEEEKEASKTGYRYNPKSFDIFNCWEKI